MPKIINIHENERKVAKFLGMSLQDFLRRKAVLLAQVNYLKKRSQRIG